MTHCNIESESTITFLKKGTMQLVISPIFVTLNDRLIRCIKLLPFSGHKTKISYNIGR